MSLEEVLDSLYTGSCSIVPGCSSPKCSAPASYGGWALAFQSMLQVPVRHLLWGTLLRDPLGRIFHCWKAPEPQCSCQSMPRAAAATLLVMLESKGKAWLMVSSHLESSGWKLHIWGVFKPYLIRDLVSLPECRDLCCCFHDVTSQNSTTQ